MKRSNKNTKKKGNKTKATSNLATPFASNNLSSILSSINNNQSSSAKTPRDTQTVVTTKTSATLQSLYAKAKHQDVDQLFEDLLGTGESTSSNNDDAINGEGGDEEKSGAEKSFGLGTITSSLGNDDSTAMSSLLPIVTTPMIQGTKTNEKKKKGSMEGNKDGGGLMSVEDEVMQILGDTSKTTATAVATDISATDDKGKRRGSCDTLMTSNQQILSAEDLDDLCGSTSAEVSRKKKSSSPLPWGNDDDDDDNKKSPLPTLTTSDKNAAATNNTPVGEIYIYGDTTTKKNDKELKNRPSTTITTTTAATANEPRHYRIAGSTTASNSVKKNNSSTSVSYRHNRARQRRVRDNNDTTNDGENSIGSHGVSSILQSMGLGPGFRNGANDDNTASIITREEISEDGTQGKDKPAGPLTRHLASLTAKTPLNNLMKNSTTESNSKSKISALEKMDRFLQRRQHRMLHLRAGMMILGLVGIMYASVQLMAVVKHDQAAMRSIKGRSGGLHSHHGGGGRHDKMSPSNMHQSWNQHTGEHEEGVDRPLANMDALRKRAGGGGNLRGTTNERTPSEIALKLVEGKVPTKREGPVDDGGGGSSIILPDDSGGSGVRRKRPYDEIDNYESNLNNAAAVEGGAPLLQSPKEKLLPAEEELESLWEKILPKSVVYLADVSKSSSSTSPMKKGDTALFWHIPRSGGTMVKDILTKCRGAVLASDAGRFSEEGTAKELKVVSINGDKYVNVDVTNTAGIERAKSLGLASAGMADAIITPYITQATSLFDADHHGRAFTLMRHPVERAASMYHYLKKNGNAEVKRLTVEEYAKSPHAENNWMVRFLTGKLGGEITDDDLLLAKELLRTKFVIGLLEYKNSSLKRFEQYFGWTYTENPKKQYSCRKNAIEKNEKGAPKGGADGSTQIKEGTQAYSLLLWQNKLDMQLYLYAQHLFNMQGQELFPNLEAKL